MGQWKCINIKVHWHGINNIQLQQCYSSVPQRNLMWCYFRHDCRWCQFCMQFMERHRRCCLPDQYSDVIMGAMASQIISLALVYSTAYWRADQRKHQSSVSLAIVRGIHRWTMNSPHKCSVTRKLFPFGDVIMTSRLYRVAVNDSCARWRMPNNCYIKLMPTPHCELSTDFSLEH